MYSPRHSITSIEMTEATAQTSLLPLSEVEWISKDTALPKVM